MKANILSRLPPALPWADNLIWLDTTDSTNDRLKALAHQGAPHGTVVIAGHQTGGHGRMGRSFQSPDGMGVYMSILLRPQAKPSELMHLTCAAAVAMCDALESAVGLRPGIKWTNDLVHNRRKLGGILTELGLSPRGGVNYAIVGIGINCCQNKDDFPLEIRDIAASLAMVTEKSVSRATVAAAMIRAMHQMDQTLLVQKEEILLRYRQDCITIGQQISVVRGDTVLHGQAMDIDADGALVVRYLNGTIEAVNSGEVSIRGMYGYI